MFSRCKRCVMPTTRPDTAFVDGVCSACLSYDRRGGIDWAARKAELQAILDAHKGECIVASSGGKDSHAIALSLLEMGAKPLIVTATTDHLTDIGKRNIQNLARFAPTIEVTPNQTVRRKIARIGLRTVGDISYGEHMAIWATPHQVAKRLGVPLIFYGENPQDELGGPLGRDEAKTMTRSWVNEHGGFLGLRARDLIGEDGITEEDIAPYLQPTEEEMGGITTYFTGQFLPWDGYWNAINARDHGFEWSEQEVEGSIGRAESLDNFQTGIHEWFKYLKYSYMRPSDIASIAIRRGRMTRDEALGRIVLREVFPWTYLGAPCGEILARIGVDFEEFKDICNQFTNYDIFERADDSWCRPLRLA